MNEAPPATIPPEPASTIDAWSLEGMKRLYFAPSSFFRSVRLDAAAGWLAAAWIVGLAGSIDRIDSQAMRAELDPDNERRRAAIELIGQAWPRYWFTAVVAGTIGAALIWLIGGWWYRVRLGWSGAQEVDRRQARLTFTFATLITAIPTILFAILQTFRYPDFNAAWASESVWQVVLIVFPFWAVFASYRGATTLFAVQQGKALWWFFILPCLFYAAILGVVGALYAGLFPSGQ